MMIQPECIWKLDAELGEGPIWIEQEAAVYFVDIKGHKIHRSSVTGQQTQSWDVGDQVSFVLPISGGGLVCGLPGKLANFSPESGQLATIKLVEEDRPGNRLNDAYVDATGCLWFGSMDDAEVNPTGALYRFTKDKIAQRVDSEYVITNGPSMSPDGKTFYHTDTVQKKIYAYDVTGDGTLSGKRLFIEIQGTGYPDGTTVDAEGFVWIALFSGWRVERYSSAGKLVQSVEFPCANVTKIAFGGNDRRTVFVTTAHKGLSAQERAQQPLAGGLFSFRVSTSGQPQYQFLHGAAA